MVSAASFAALACLALATLSAAMVVPPGKCLDLSDPVATCQSDVCSMAGSVCKKSCVHDRCDGCDPKCTCATDADCDESEWCRNTLIPDNVGICVPLAKEGEACEGRQIGAYANRCAPGLICIHHLNMRGDMPGQCAPLNAAPAPAAAVAAPTSMVVIPNQCYFDKSSDKPCTSRVLSQRWFMNTETGECSAYTSCHDTNYDSLEECASACAFAAAPAEPLPSSAIAPVAEAKTVQPSCAFDNEADKPCLSQIAIQRWYYSATAGDCKSYVTCRLTNFDSYTECKSSCAATAAVALAKSVDSCSAVPDLTKPCYSRVLFQRWYFSSAAGKCVSYTTCHDDFFQSESDCAQACQ